MIGPIIKKGRSSSGKRGSRKYGRNLLKCKRYRAEGRREKNKARREAKRQRKFAKRKAKRKILMGVG